MSEELLRWKDEDYRGDHPLADHPAGDIDLSAIGGQEALPSSWPCVFGVTLALSCSPSCEHTLFHGSCGVSTVGCCEATT